MLTGFGQPVLAQPENGTLHYGRWSAFSFGVESEIKEASAWPFDGGAQQVVDSAIGKTTYTLKLTTQSINKLDLSHFLNVKIAKSASVQFPAAFQGTIPATTPFEIAVSGLTADQAVEVAIIDTKNPSYMKQVTDAPDAAGEYRVVAGKIVFDEDDAGKLVVYRYLKTYTNVDTIGVENATSYGYWQFSGILRGTRMPDDTPIFFGQISPKGSFEASLADDVPSFEMEYSVSTPAGWPLPYRIGYGLVAS